MQQRQQAGRQLRGAQAVDYVWRVGDVGQQPGQLCTQGKRAPAHGLSEQGGQLLRRVDLQQGVCYLHTDGLYQSKSESGVKRDCSRCLPLLLQARAMQGKGMQLFASKQQIQEQHKCNS